VIHNGVEHLPDIAPTRPNVQVGDNFFFSISLFTRKKNFEVLLPMMKYFPDYELVLSGDHETNYGVFLSNSSSLPEIGGDAAYYFSDYDPEHMAQCIKHSLYQFESDKFNNSKRMMDQAAKFTWSKSMEKYINLYRKLTN